MTVPLPIDRQESSAVPHAVWSEREADGAGHTVRVATILLKGPRCVLKCRHCDLWQFATNQPSRAGDILNQVETALEQLPECQWIKLYNGGNFVDPRSIPQADLKPLAKLCSGFERVIVENHPRMMRDSLFRFAEGLSGKLEVAMGLETANERVLRQLNKSMTLGDFAAAAEKLNRSGIDIRSFVVAGLPGTSMDVKRDCMQSIHFAQVCGARHISIIPLRATNLVMQISARAGKCPPVSLPVLEAIMRDAAGRRRSVVTVDLWDLHRVTACPSCVTLRKQRIATMNLRQVALAPLHCPRCCV